MSDSRPVAAATIAAAGQRWVLRAGAVLLPLTYWPLTYDHYVLPKVLVARSLVLALAVLLIVRWLAAGAVVFKRTPLDLPLVAFLVSALVSAVVGINVNVGLFGTYTRYDGALTLITYAALFWLAVQALENSEDARGLLRFMLAGAYLVAVVAIGQWLFDSIQGQPTPRAFGTMGNANILGAYLAMLTPLAYHELREARSTAGRIVTGSVLFTMGLAVLLTVSHSAWLGLAVAAGILVAGGQFPALSRRRQIAFALGTIALLAAAAPIALSRSTDIAQRVHIWQDSISLIAGRPLLGYGPDTFGLVYPGYQTGQWVLGYVQIDKAHSEVLQVAATQGLIGVAIYSWILAVFVFAFWRGRHAPAAWPLFAGFAAYEVVLLLNFTALASAFPFWILAAAAFVAWGACWEIRVARRPPGLPATAAGGVAVAAMLMLAVPAVVLPYMADETLNRAVAAQFSSHLSDAGRLAAESRGLAPRESVYAVEAGNIAFEGGDWQGARAAYLDAIRLGTFNPRLYRNLAIADRSLGLRDEAVSAARQAVFLDRFDPSNQALLADMLGAP